MVPRSLAGDESKGSDTQESIKRTRIGPPGLWSRSHLRNIAPGTTATSSARAATWGRDRRKTRHFAPSPRPRRIARIAGDMAVLKNSTLTWAYAPVTPTYATPLSGASPTATSLRIARLTP
ncbi:hypothetical protein SAMN05216489_07829 [Streptomyces sp. 3213]|nr:hypothetical protein SAMN05216489_07829 [Streptomyces sp. 3213] [Streptomyces sp. 3213.3]